MKKSFLKIIYFLVFMCASAYSNAGIPVIDGSAVANLVLQYKQLQQQYQVMQTQLSGVTGSRGMGGLLTNPAVYSSLPPQWSNVLSSIKNSPTYAAERALLPTSPIPSVNAIYDNQAAHKATMTDFFNKANQRLAQVAQLQASVDSASDPAAKQDLQNRIVSEQNSIAATSQLLTVLKQKQENEIEQARQTAHRSYVCSEFKGQNCP